MLTLRVLCVGCGILYDYITDDVFYIHIDWLLSFFFGFMTLFYFYLWFRYFIIFKAMFNGIKYENQRCVLMRHKIALSGAVHPSKNTQKWNKNDPKKIVDAWSDENEIVRFYCFIWISCLKFFFFWIWWWRLSETFFVSGIFWTLVNKNQWMINNIAKTDSKQYKWLLQIFVLTFSDKSIFNPILNLYFFI